MKYNSERFLHVWEDILQIWVSGYLKIISEERRNQISPKSHFKKTILVFKEFLKGFIKVFVCNNIPEKKIWFFSISSNNYEALNLIKNNIENSIFVEPHSFKVKSNSGYRLNLQFKFFYDVLFLINLLFFKSKNKNLKVKVFYDLLFKSNGVYSECIRVLNCYKPKGIVFANDHEIMPRGLLLAAKHLEIPTFYIQHASVSNYFPALDFDYALLEGQDSKDKYLKIGETNSEIYLVGMPKFDKYVEFVNTNKVIRKIGVAYNAMDSIDKISKVSNKLKEAFPDLDFIIRPHPADTRDLNIKGMKKSNPKEETAFHFLSKLDALIAAESSIHLEAIMLNVYSMSFNFNESQFLDYYGFVKNNLIKHFDNINDLEDEIKKNKQTKPNVQQKAIYYNAALNSDFYGKSVERIHGIIKSRTQ